MKEWSFYKTDCPKTIDKTQLHKYNPRSFPSHRQTGVTLDSWCYKLLNITIKDCTELDYTFNEIEGASLYKFPILFPTKAGAEQVQQIADPDLVI
jgi:hypothetical protein